jgi:hypothetical protein
MGDLLGSFPESVQVMTKLAEKTRVGLWGLSVILKAVWGVTTIPSKHFFLLILSKLYWFSSCEYNLIGSIRTLHLHVLCGDRDLNLDNLVYLF